MSPLRIAIGPELSTFGSWNWLGLGLLKAMSRSCSVTVFRDVDDPPPADCVVFLKFKPFASRLAELRRRSALVYMPVDIYDSCREIDSDADALQSIDLLFLHSRRLQRYFSCSPRVEVVEHPLRFHLPTPRMPVTEGPLLWVGRRCNLEPIVQWSNSLRSDEELWILTDRGELRDSARELGFRSDARVRIEEWTAERHLEWQVTAQAAVDIKGTDFRSRHKPPAKMLDFLASAVPVLTNRGSAPWLYAASENLRVVESSRWPNLEIPLDFSLLQRQAEYLQNTLTERLVYSQYEQAMTEVCNLWREQHA